MEVDLVSESEVDILEEEEEVPDLVVGNKRKRSEYYQFFTLEDGKKYVCKSSGCRQKYELPKTGSTSALVKHIKIAHPNLLEKRDAKEGDRLRDMLSKTKEKDGIEPITNENYRKFLTELIVCTNQPHTLVEDDSFRRYTIFCLGQNAKKIDIPCRTTVKVSIEERYLQARNNLKEELKRISSRVSLVIDGWTSKTQHSFLGIIIQWITDDWELVRIPLDLHLLQGGHSGKNIAQAVASVISEFGIWGKLLGITTDNASNMDTFFEEFSKLADVNGVEFNPEHQRVRCLAHILNLATKAVIANVSHIVSNSEAQTREESSTSQDQNTTKSKERNFKNNVVEKIRNGVQKIRSSPQRRGRFVDQCHVAKITPKELILDCPTRWDSTLDMLERCEELKIPFQFTLSTIPELTVFLPDETEWMRVRKIVNLLKPIREMTKMLSTGSTPSISKCVSVYQNLLNHFDKMIAPEVPTASRRSVTNKSTQEQWIIDAATAGKNKLLKYFPSTDGLVHVVSTFVDPRLKMVWFKAVGWPKPWIENNLALIKKEWSKNYEKRVNITHEDQNIPDLPFGTELLLRQMSGFTESTEPDEFKRYLQEKPIGMIRFLPAGTNANVYDGILDWWKVNEHEFPNLAKMAKDYLAVSGTGVPAEQFFSGGPDVITLRRGRLLPGSITCNMCLKAWILCGKKLPNFHDLFLSCVEFKAFEGGTSDEQDESIRTAAPILHD